MTLPNNTLLQGGKYRIVRFISSGGFGCTYEGVHVLLGKRVAIKEFFVKDFCNRDETTSHVTVGTQTKVALVLKLKRKFIEEASALGRFNHPNIVHVSDVFEENGTAYYVMDFIDGKSINEILKTQSTIPESKAVKYILQVAEALKQVHAKNRLHLDIKPGNIMIDSNDNAVLIDFGASKQYDEEAGENTSTIMGYTMGYAPLEQIGNNMQHFTPATDIYALGATLYKMLSGKTPPSATLLAGGDELDPLPDAISEETISTVENAMIVSKKDRTQTLKDFIDGFNDAYEDYSDDLTDDDIDDDVEETVINTSDTNNIVDDKTSSDSVIPENTSDWDYETCETVLELMHHPKYGFWLKFFLVILCLNGVGYLLISLVDYSGISIYINPMVAVINVVVTVILCGLTMITTHAFIKRRPDAVFLGKLFLISIFIYECLNNLSPLYDSEAFASLIRNLIWCVIWFVYLCVSKRVEEVIPNRCRRMRKRDYIISGFLIAAFILYYASYNI